MLKVKNKEDKYLLSTVRLETDTGTGTGFICQLTNPKYGDLTNIFFLITNKHVIQNAKEMTIKMHKMDSAKANNTTKHIEINLDNQEEITLEEDMNSLFYFHPNEKIDIAILNMNQNVLKKFIPLLLAIEIDSIIPNENSEIGIYDDVTFIGYPNGLYDQKNLLPIIRKGVFATPYQVDFNHEKIFLIDASVFPGSSGSPVFLFDRQDIQEGGTKLRLYQPRIFFLGIISAVYTQDDLFDIIQTSSIKAHGKHMLDIGIVYKASEIRKLIKFYFIDEILKVKVEEESFDNEQIIDKTLVQLMEAHKLAAEIKKYPQTYE